MSQTPMITPRLLQFCTIVVLASTSVISGLTPDRLLSQTPESQQAYAQESSFTRYVRATFEMEVERRSMMSKLKEIAGDLPENVCGDGFKQVQGNFQGSVRDFCNRFNASASRIVSKHNVSGEFNGFQQQTKSKNPDISRAMNKRMADERKRLNLFF
jgi:hypothetical protein